MVELFAISGDLDQMPHSAVSDLGLHCLPIALLGSPGSLAPRHEFYISNLTKVNFSSLTIFLHISSPLPVRNS